MHTRIEIDKTLLAKYFIETYVNYQFDHGREKNIESRILSADIPVDAKEILLWRFYERLFIKQIGVRLQKKLNLVEPLSDRQVSRRLNKACELFFPIFLNT